MHNAPCGSRYAIRPDHAIEQVNSLMNINGGLKGLTQNPSPMARWSLIAREQSHPVNEAEHLAGTAGQRSLTISP